MQSTVEIKSPDVSNIIDTPTERKRVPFRQTTVSGCASLSLANLWNDDRYLEGIADLKFGEKCVDLNRKLDKFSGDIYVEPIIVISSHLVLQENRLIDDAIFKIDWDQVAEYEKENWARPLLITFKRKSGICHCILVLHNLKNNLLHVVDSMAEYIEVMPPFELIKRYHILEVEHFGKWSMEKPEHSVFIHKTEFHHLFQPGE